MVSQCDFTVSPSKAKKHYLLILMRSDLFNNNFTLPLQWRFQKTEKVKLRKKQITGFAKIGLTYDITKHKTLEFTGK
jgi:hypothetical protein